MDKSTDQNTLIKQKAAPECDSPDLGIVGGDLPLANPVRTLQVES